MCQISHYPLLADVGDLTRYQPRNQRLTTYVVGLPMLVELATGDPMVSVVGAVRTALSDNGAFVDHLACLPNETATMGCTGGLIPIRTLAPRPGIVVSRALSDRASP